MTKENIEKKFPGNPEWNEILPTLTKYQRDKHKDKIGIYLIKLGNLIYIGQTTTSFNERFSSHKRALQKAIDEVTLNPFNTELWQSETLYLTMAQCGYINFVDYVEKQGTKLNINMLSLSVNNYIINNLEYYLIEAYDKDYFGNLNKHTIQKTFYDKEHWYIKKYQSVRYGFNQFEILEFIRSKVRMNKILSDSEFKKWKRLLFEYNKVTKQVIKELEMLEELEKQGKDEEVLNQMIKYNSKFYHIKVFETNENLLRYIEASSNFTYPQLVESISIVEKFKESEIDDEQEDFN